MSISRIKKIAKIITSTKSLSSHNNLNIAKSIKLAIFIFLTLFLLVKFGLINVHHTFAAYSLNPNNIPEYQWNNELTYDNPTLIGKPYYGPGGPVNDPQEFPWLQISGQSGAQQTSTTLQSSPYAYGSAPKISFDYNYSQFFWTGWTTRYPNQPGTPGGYSYPQTQPPPSSLNQNGNETMSQEKVFSVGYSGLAGMRISGTTSAVQIITPDNNYRYWFANPTMTFSIQLPPLTSANLTWDPTTNAYYATIKVVPVTASINEFGSAYLCVATGANMGGWNFTPCKPYNNLPYYVQVNVSSAPDNNPPHITANWSCASAITGVASDADYPPPFKGPDLTVNYTVTPGVSGSTTTDGVGNYSINMSAYNNPYITYSVNISTPDVNSAGTVTNKFPPAHPNPNPVLYGPCLMPYFYVRGGDVLTGSGGVLRASSPSCSGTNANAGILAANNISNSPAYQQGSGGDLAAYAPNDVNGYATSNGLSPLTSNDGKFIPLINYNYKPPEGLTFANDLQYSNTYGRTYGGGLLSYDGSCASDYFTAATTLSGITTATPTNTFNINSLPRSTCKSLPPPATTTYCYLTPNPKTYLRLIDGGASFGGHLVVVVTGNVVIASDIVLNTGSINPWTSVSDIPNFWLIVKGNIYVTSTVSRLDGDYIAQPTITNGKFDIGTGQIFTCTNGDTNYSGNLYSNCNQQSLNVNGAMVADQLRLNRTRILCSLCNPGTVPAESFNYGPIDWITNPLSSGAPLPLTPSYQSITALAPVL